MRDIGYSTLCPCGRIEAGVGHMKRRWGGVNDIMWLCEKHKLYGKGFVRMSNRVFEGFQSRAVAFGEEAYGDFIFEKYGHGDLSKLTTEQGRDALRIFLVTYQDKMDEQLDESSPF